MLLLSRELAECQSPRVSCTANCSHALANTDTSPVKDLYVQRSACMKNGRCFPISGSEVRKTVRCSTDIKENLWLWCSRIFWLSFFWKKSCDSTLRHQKLFPIGRQEVSVLSSLSCWAWYWWGIIVAFRLPMHGGFHLRRKHPNPPNRIRIRSATQRAWVLDLDASSRREGISTKTSLAQSPQLKEMTFKISIVVFQTL